MGQCLMRKQSNFHQGIVEAILSKAQLTTKVRVTGYRKSYKYMTICIIEKIIIIFYIVISLQYGMVTVNKILILT